MRTVTPQSSRASSSAMPWTDVSSTEVPLPEVPLPASVPARAWPWRGWLIYTHRWLGIVGCLLFIAWFISGIVMMYRRMPTVTPDERLLHAEPLALGSLRLTPSEAAAKAGAKNAAGVELGMLFGRPVYRFLGRTPRTVFADDASQLESFTATDAMNVARAWSPASASTARYLALVTIPDQWTLQYRQHLPIHEIALGDAADTHLYISSRAGEVVVDASRRERFWGYLGPVMHWLYLPVLRRNGPLWTQVIIWSSGIGCVMCVAGLLVGLQRFSPSARFRRRRGGARSPYDGFMKWHHYAGLLFGVVTLTWTFSGLMSMGPFGWLSDGAEPSELRSAVTGNAPAYGAITVSEIQSAAEGIAHDFTPRFMSLTAFKGEPFWSTDAAPMVLPTDARTRFENAPKLHRLISATHPERRAFARFDNATMEQVARDAMPGVGITDATWLTEYDTYYLHRNGERPLPVYRVRYADLKSTWIYFDPQRGSAALVLRPKERLDRWLYEGLHRLSFPVLYFRRPLWDVVLIVLLLGGTALGVTTLIPAFRRLRRRAKALFQRPAEGIQSTL